MLALRFTQSIRTLMGIMMSKSITVFHSCLTNLILPVLWLGKKKVLTAIEELNEQGVKKVLVQSKRMVDDKTEEFCMENNIELTIGCALMAEGKGLHRFHGFLAGVK